MATGLRFEGQDPPDDHRLKENFDYISGNKYLKSSLPLGLRRNVSLEDTSINNNSNFLQKNSKENCSDLSLANSSLCSSLQSLCLRLRPYQLLAELNSNVARLDNEHQFDWWNTLDHLKPLIENIILKQQLTNDFEDDINQQDIHFIQFQKSKRNGRRNDICFAIDRLCYNEQMILFVAITSELQIEYNLISLGLYI